MKLEKVITFGCKKSEFWVKRGHKFIMFRSEFLSVPVSSYVLVHVGNGMRFFISQFFCDKFLLNVTLDCEMFALVKVIHAFLPVWSEI